MIRSVRWNAGMRVDSNNVPDCVYTNQSECVNSKLAARKASLGYSKKDDLSKINFIRNVWQPLVMMQDREIEKAIYGASSEYQVVDCALHLKVQTEIWYQWSTNKRKKYVDTFRSLSLKDIQEGKTIDIDEGSDSDIYREAISNLSIDIVAALPHILHADLINQKALKILNSSNAIVEVPSMEAETSAKRYFIAGKGLQPNSVKVTSQKKVICSCPAFKYTKICSHSVAVAERHKILSHLLANVKISCRSSLTYPESAAGIGRKGEQRRRKRKYQDSSDVSSQQKRRSLGQPITEIWHNNEPFFVTFVDKVPAEKSYCGQCKQGFPRGILACIPFDIVLKHQERWQYLNRDRKSEAEPLYLPSPGNKLTTKFYCISKKCIMSRFPYFREELLQIPMAIKLQLKDSHKKLFVEQLGIIV